MLPVPIPIEDFGRQTSEFATEVGSLKSEVEESDGVPAVTRPAGGILPRPSATPSILEGEFAPNSSPKTGEVPRSGGGVCPLPGFWGTVPFQLVLPMCKCCQCQFQFPIEE